MAKLERNPTNQPSIEKIIGENLQTPWYFCSSTALRFQSTTPKKKNAATQKHLVQLRNFLQSSQFTVLSFLSGTPHSDTVLSPGSTPEQRPQQVYCIDSGSGGSSG